MQVYDKQEKLWLQTHSNTREMLFHPVMPIVFYSGTRTWTEIKKMRQLVHHGELFGPMAQTYAYALGGSLLLALTLTPVLCLLLFRNLKPVGENILVWQPMFCGEGATSSTPYRFSTGLRREMGLS